MNRFYGLKLLSGANVLEIFVNPGLASDYAIALPSVSPADGQTLMSDANGNLRWETIGSVGGGGGSGTTSSTYTLNNDFTTGDPVDNGTFQFLRGDNPTAMFQWDEDANRWTAGMEGRLAPLARIHRQSFTNDDRDTTNKIVVITHNLGFKPIVQVYDNTGATIGLDIKHTSVDVYTIDTKRVTNLEGTWTTIATG